MSQESAGERRLALGEWYREGSKSLTQLSLKKSLRSLSAPFVLFGSILNSTLGGRRIKEKEGEKKEKKKKIFPPTNKILQILTGDYKRQ